MEGAIESCALSELVQNSFVRMGMPVLFWKSVCHHNLVGLFCRPIHPFASRRGGESTFPGHQFEAAAHERSRRLYWPFVTGARPGWASGL